MSEYKVPKYLKREDDKLLYNGDGEFYFYIPEIFFEREYAIFIGDIISTIGIIDYSVYNTNNEKYGEEKLHTFYFPAVFLTKPYTTVKVKNLRLGRDEPKDYRILKYKKGDEIVVSVKVPQLVDNVEDFYRLFLITANIPPTVKYGTIWKYYIDSMALAGASYNITNAAFALIESEQCRDPDDLSKPFRLSKKRNDRLAYKPLSIKEIPKHVSAYTALTSENWDRSVIAACLNKEEKYTPLEKVLMQ